MQSDLAEQWKLYARGGTREVRLPESARSLLACSDVWDGRNFIEVDPERSVADFMRALAALSRALLRMLPADDREGIRMCADHAALALLEMESGHVAGAGEYLAELDRAARRLRSA